MVHLEPLPDTVPTRVLIGACVRKPATVVRAWLDHLAGQDLPPNTEFHWCFVDDNEDMESSAILGKFLDEHGGTLIEPETLAEGYDDTNPQTHQWTGGAMLRVGALKDQIIQLALREGYDALWFVDADVLCGPTTYRSLAACDAPIACGVFWTRWQNTPDCPPLPQVWLRHPYQLDGRGMDQGEFLGKLMARHRVQVWGQGACTLIRADALQKGVSFGFLPDLPREGLWQGEDRHFCVRAERLHLPMIADAWPEIVHIYHPEDLDRIAEATERLSDLPESSESPDLADQVSLVLQAIEPVSTGPGGQQMQLPPFHVRGVMSGLPLNRDLRDAILGMRRGGTRIVACRFGEGHPVFRGARRLIKVTLVDHRPDRPPIGTE